MHDDVVAIHVNQDVLLLGSFGALSRLPRALRKLGRAQMVLPNLAAMPAAMHKLRAYWADRFSSHLLVNLSDHDVLRIVGGAIENGQLQALVIPRFVPVQTLGTAKQTNRAGTRSTAQNSGVGPPPPMRAAGTVVPGIAGVGSPPLGAAASTTAQPLPVAQWPLEDRVAAVIRRAVPKVPGDVGATLLSLLTPESLAIVVATIVVSAGANLTPYGWIADAVIVGIAFGFGGLAAIHALGDLVECFKRTASAKSDQDLDAAADSLARAVVGLGVVAIMVVLHRVAGREGAKTGSGSTSAGEAAQQATEKELAPARAERLQARRAAQQANARAEQEAAAARKLAAQRSTLDENVASGRAFEQKGLDHLEGVQTDVQSQVSIRPYTDSGELADYRVRLDALGRDEAGNLHLTDFKSSDTAGFTPNQQTGYPLIEKYGGQVVGNNGGAAYPAGFQIPPTQVDVLRPGDF
jgi:hypothetical protein